MQDDNILGPEASRSPHLGNAEVKGYLRNSEVDEGNQEIILANSKRSNVGIAVPALRLDALCCTYILQAKTHVTLTCN
jgi:hypothetical protein